jgi:hypothetical protein
MKLQILAIVCLTFAAIEGLQAFFVPYMIKEHFFVPYMTMEHFFVP